MKRTENIKSVVHPQWNQTRKQYQKGNRKISKHLEFKQHTSTEQSID